MLLRGDIFIGHIFTQFATIHRYKYFNDDPKEIAKFCLDYIEYIIKHEGEISAILLEPIRATDVHVPPIDYFKRLRKFVMIRVFYSYSMKFQRRLEEVENFMCIKILK